MYGRNFGCWGALEAIHWISHERLYATNALCGLSETGEVLLHLHWFISRCGSWRSQNWVVYKCSSRRMSYHAHQHRDRLQLHFWKSMTTDIHLQMRDEIKDIDDWLCKTLDDSGERMTPIDGYSTLADSNVLGRHGNEGHFPGES